MSTKSKKETLNIIVMGKTGAGKSTLINSVLDEELAPVGVGAAITKENIWYSTDVIADVNDPNKSKPYSVKMKLNILDTVGLEISHDITTATIEDIKNHMDELSSHDKAEKSLVWFCINDRSNRLEDYEADLIHNLSIEYEIPFIIVFTQCINKTGELKESLTNNLSDIVTQDILAQEFKARGINIPAFGVDELLGISIARYNDLKVKVLEDKLLALDSKRLKHINDLEEQGEKVISIYSRRAGDIGRKLFPGKTAYIKKIRRDMIKELTRLLGVKRDAFDMDSITDRIANGLVNGALMKLPLTAGEIAAESYIEDDGYTCLRSMVSLLKHSTNAEIENEKDLLDKYIKEIRNS